MNKTNTLKQIYKHPCNFAFKKKIDNDGRFSHGVYLAEKWKKGERKSQWYAKYLGEKREETLAEILTQELMRLILPQQPKTRRVIDITRKGRIVYYILSKEIPEFDDTFFLKKESNELFFTKSITGLAATQVLSLWLNEIDFKAGNVGIDHHKEKVIKIDGGLSLVALNKNLKHLHDRNFNITSTDLEALPNLINYQACNWLHHIQWNKQGYAVKNEPTVFDKRINQSPSFKKELYRTILQISSLPNSLIQFFTQCYIANFNDAMRFSDFIISRKIQLEFAADQISEFKKYRQSEQAQQEMLAFSKQVTDFRPQEKLSLSSGYKIKHNIDIATAIKEYVPIKNFITALDNFIQFLNSIDSDKWSLDHKKIIGYIESLKETTMTFNSANNGLNKALTNSLIELVKTIKNEFAKRDSIIPSLIESINNLLSVMDNSKKIKECIPSPQPIFTLLPSIRFFNEAYLKIDKINPESDSLQLHEFIY